MPEALKLVRDNDCHWYPIPWDKSREWHTGLDDDPEFPLVIDWARRVDGPQSLKIYQYEEA